MYKILILSFFLPYHLFAQKIDSEISTYYKVEKNDTIQSLNNANLKSFIQKYDSNNNIIEKYIDKSALGEKSKILLIEKNEFEKGKIVKSIHYSFLNGKKIREENYNYSSDILIEKRIETYNNNEQVTKFPNYIYQVKYTYPNKKEKIEGRYFYENNKLKLREKKAFTLDENGNILIEKFLTGQEPMQLIYKYDLQNNLIEKKYESKYEKYEYTKYDKFKNWIEMMSYNSENSDKVIVRRNITYR